MALNFSTTKTDYVQRTAESRRITKTLVGDFTFDHFSDQHRNKTFLPRNMTKVLAFHERNHTRDIEVGTFRSASSRTRGPILSNNTSVTKTDVNTNGVKGIKDKRTTRAVGHDAANAQDSTNGKPDIETMSQDCLKVKARDESRQEPSRETRRSVRNLASRQHEEKNAQLFLDIINIRKKLNFKENAQGDDARPRKRMRRESVTCHCHVTIWDNRLGREQKEPIIRKSEICNISTTNLGSEGYLAEVTLQKAFVFKASELHVERKTSNGTVLGIGDKYFLEIKIIPTRSDVEWPPIPVLGRSEGDQTTGLGRMAAERLQNTLCARYMHLPQAPPSDVPLSVFYLHEGSTYRSKYGLEVNAVWSKGEIPEMMVKKEEDPPLLDLWAVDDEGRAFGRRTSPPAPEFHKTRNKQTSNAPAPVKVVFNIDAASAKGVKDFRKATVTGLLCTVCPKLKFKNLEDLQFHFTTCHSKYKFAIEKQDVNPITNELSSVVFKISAIGTARPRNQDRETRKNDKDLNWQAPKEPLDVYAYVNGDQNWVEQNWVEGKPKNVENQTVNIEVFPDTLSNLRHRTYGGFGPAQKGGFLPAEHVAAFRDSTRTKYPNIKLRTMLADKEIMYTSVSHSQVRVGESARSESDDEMDDGWFIKKSLEALDIAAEKHNWTEDQRVLRHKWNKARLGEKLSHPRYLSDCLIRFVRSEKEWLNQGDIERRTAFAEFVNEFLQRRVINQEVTRDLWTILNNDKDNVPDGTNEETKYKDEAMSQTTRVTNTGRSQKLTSRQERAESMLQLPPYTCAVCVKPIEELRRHGLRCSEHECEAPGVWYHSHCVRCKRKDRLGWKCVLCVERLDEIRKDKGKEAAID